MLLEFVSFLLLEILFVADVVCVISFCMFIFILVSFTCGSIVDTISRVASSIFSFVISPDILVHFWFIMGYTILYISG